MLLLESLTFKKLCDFTKRQLFFKLKSPKTCFVFCFLLYEILILISSTYSVMFYLNILRLEVLLSGQSNVIFNRINLKHMEKC